jgi:hypothetical protein
MTASLILLFAKKVFRVPPTSLSRHSAAKAEEGRRMRATSVEYSDFWHRTLFSAFAFRLEKTGLLETCSQLQQRNCP